MTSDESLQKESALIFLFNREIQEYVRNLSAVQKTSNI
jgi:hypothetical protein